MTLEPEPFLACGGALEVLAVPAASDNLVWLLRCTATGTVGVVDGPSADEALAACARRGWAAPTVILNTHTHGDHVGINADLLSRADAAVRVFGPAGAADRVPGLTDPVDEGDTVAVGAVTGRVWLTEGHLDGHVSFVFGDALFCGDTLFAGGCGYLFDGPPSKMHESLSRLASLDGTTRVCCAHEYTQDNLRFAWSVEPDNAALAERIRAVWAVRARGGCTLPSTIGLERRTNPFLRLDSPGLRAALAAASPDADLGTPVSAFAALRALKDRKEYRRLPEDALPLAG